MPQGWISSFSFGERDCSCPGAPVRGPLLSWGPSQPLICLLLTLQPLRLQASPRAATGFRGCRSGWEQKSRKGELERPLACELRLGGASPGIWRVRLYREGLLAVDDPKSQTLEVTVVIIKIGLPPFRQKQSSFAEPWCWLIGLPLSWEGREISQLSCCNQALLWGACPARDFTISLMVARIFPLLLTTGEKQDRKKKEFAQKMEDVNEIKVRIFKLQKFSAFKHPQALLKHPFRDCWLIRGDELFLSHHQCRSLALWRATLG